MDNKRIRNTDGKRTYDILMQNLIVKNDKIDYTEETHKLYFLNKIVSNFSSMILGVYHGIDKRLIPLYFSEFEWRFNHRHTKDIIKKMCVYIQQSCIMTKQMIKKSLDTYAFDRKLILE